MILEGLEYCILDRKAFAMSPKKLEDFPPYAFSYIMHFHVPSILHVCLPWVDVHSVICETYLVWWYYMDLWSIGGGGPWFMCILLYVKLIW